ncbi:excinuclease ABC subunit A, partial [Leclercia adecarboxylata]|nr:excinuclease ABC subunit A [Leclercia adecarboxylata]
VLHTFATTQSAMMKKRVARYMIGAQCPVCDGRRLKREALSVTFAGMDIGTLSQLPLSAMAQALRPAAEGHFDAPATTATRSRSAGRQATAKRVAAGGNAHAGGSDVRRTPDLSEEKRIAAQRIAHDLVERIGTLQSLGLG